MEANREIISNFSRYLKAAGKSEATVECYCRDARLFFDFIDGQSIDFNCIESQTLWFYKDCLETTDKDNSIRRKIIGIRQLFRYLKLTHIIESTPFDEVPIPSRDESIPLAIDHESIDRVLRHYEQPRLDSLKSLRDAAMLYLLARAGLKADELIHLKWSHYHPSSITPTLFISGKRERTIEICKKTSSALDQYKKELVRFNSSSPTPSDLETMFVAFKGKDCLLLIPNLTRHGLKFALYEIGRRFNIPSLTTEMLRHYAIQQFVVNGTSLEDLLRHLGLRRPGNVGKHFGYLTGIIQKQDITCP